MDESTPARPLPRVLLYILIFGLYLTLRGYHSRDGDHAYRLPLLIHQQDPTIFENDPFVRAFDRFNPHVGSLTLLDWVSRPAGLSAGLFALFALTFLGTVWGVDRLARAVWPEGGSLAGLAAIGCVLIAKAGNVGTNHLFEAMLLDRLMAFALAWVALAVAVERPWRGAVVGPVCLGLATLIHPSLGLQLATVLGASWVVWFANARGGTFGVRGLIGGLVWLGVALLPGLVLNMGQGGNLLDGLPAEDFRLLSVELQGPQHMVPHLWRLPQWLAWGCYLVLAGLGWMERSRDDPSGGAQVRLAAVLVVILAALGVSWVAVEVVRDLRFTLFQPFRLATVARGVALVLASGRLVSLWRSGRLIDRVRVALLGVGLAGDWAFVVATLFDAAVAVVDRVADWAFSVGVALCLPPLTPPFQGGELRSAPSSKNSPPWEGGVRGGGEQTVADALPAWGRLIVVVATLGAGLWFLSRHDTESGHIPLFVATAAVIASRALQHVLTRLRPATSDQIRWAVPTRPNWNRRRVVAALLAAWALPALSLALTARVERGHASPWQVALVERCRFTATPVDDIERLAVWCREHTPRDARFVGPPGPKTFRLWSLRSVAFNRAASPYTAAGLGDWFRRFQDHVGDHSTPAAFVRSYQNDRHGLEQRYQALSDTERAALARRQGADYVIAAPPKQASPTGPLELLHVEGRYGVYRVRPGAATLAASAGTG